MHWTEFSLNVLKLWKPFALIVQTTLFNVESIVYFIVLWFVCWDWGWGGGGVSRSGIFLLICFVLRTSFLISITCNDYIFFLALSIMDYQMWPCLSQWEGEKCICVLSKVFVKIKKRIWFLLCCYFKRTSITAKIWDFWLETKR